MQNLENRLRYEDFIEIQPLDGRRRRIPLLRTRILIHCRKGLTEAFDSQKFSLRGQKIVREFEIVQTLFEGTKVFMLRSLGNLPFLHNGNYSFNSILKRRDVIDIEYYRFVFKENRPQKEKRDISDLMKVDQWPDEMFVCLEGETGSGKTSLARRIHDHFVGEQSPFVAINLSALSEGLIESELFGHEKGSFTGAINEKRGAIELAKGGTLFIDELDSLPKYLQIKILTFLDDRSYRRVGGERERKGKCRLIFSSGQRLESLVGKDLFRKDLFYRVKSGINLQLPSLRQDRSLIEKALINFELEKAVTLSKELKEYLLNYDWPGNYRELHSHLMRKYLYRGRSSLLVLDAFEGELAGAQKRHFESIHDDEFDSLEKVKRDYCQKVYLCSQGSLERASKRLGIAKSTLRRVLAA